MRVDLLPFGVLKDGMSASSLELPAGATVADVLSIVGDKFSQRPDLASLLSSIAVSVNAEYAPLEQILKDGDEIGLLPPVSGGSSVIASDVQQAVITALTRDVIASDALISDVKKASDGAVVIFDGIVRDNTRGRNTLYLDYEAYEEMAEKQVASLAHQAIARFGVRAVTLVHRLGRLQIGETSVLIVVASAHRGPAFDACRWLIDTLKKTVPIWKKETFVDGIVWADGEPFPPNLITQSGSPQSFSAMEEGVAERSDPLAAPEAAV